MKDPQAPGKPAPPGDTGQHLYATTRKPLPNNTTRHHTEPTPITTQNPGENGLACPPDNRLVGPGAGQWSTDVVDGVVHWHPPESLDVGQATVNYRNRPEQIPLPDENAPLPRESTVPAPPLPPTTDMPKTLQDNNKVSSESEPGSPETSESEADVAPRGDARSPRGRVIPDDVFLATWAAATADCPNPVTTLAEAESARRLTLMGFDISVEIDLDDDALDTGSDREPFEVRPDVAPFEHRDDEIDGWDEPPPPVDWFEYWEPDDIPGPEPPGSAVA